MIATRNRVNWLNETLRSILDTVSDPKNIEIIIRYDNDDMQTHSYIAGLSNNIRVISLRKPREINKAKFFNEMANVATYDILGGFSDDFRFRTVNWDKFIISKYKEINPLSVIWGRDGIQDEKLTTHFFCTKKFRNVLGYIWYEGLPVAFCDNWMTETIKKTNLDVYINELYFEHLHPDAGKAQRDIVYNESHCQANNDAIKWNQSQYLLQQDIEKLLKVKE